MQWKCTIYDLFEKHDDEFNKFDRVQHKLSENQELHGYLLLVKLFPNEARILQSAEHDMVWIGPESDDLESLTEAQIIELLRCGIHFDGDNDSLAMFV